MIDFYTWSTPNGRKVSIMLEECGLPYAAHAVDINKDEQFKPDFLKISPNNRIPAIVDSDTGIPLFESGAILMYLAEKTGRFWSTEPKARWHTAQWVMWQMGGLGPMLGQNGHFKLYAPEKIPYAIDRYEREAKRLYGVLDGQVGRTGRFVAGDYSIADMACFPWIMTHKAQGLSLDDYPNLKRWFAEVRARPAVQKGLAVGKEAEKAPMDDEARRIMFGITKDTPGAKAS